VLRHALIAAAALLVACGHHATSPAPPPTPPAPPVVAAPPPDAAPSADAPLPLAHDPAALALRIVGVIEDLATATGAGDCAAITKAVADLRTRDAEVVDAAHKADAGGNGAAVKAAIDPYRDRVRAALETITRHTAPCAKDVELERAIDALFGG
jgi:hypothetical protein